MKTTTKKLKYNDLTYRLHDMREFYQAQNLLNELKNNIIKYDVNHTINFKLYDLFYCISEDEVDDFYDFCDEVYNFYFMEDIKDVDGYGDLTKLVELRPLGRTSSNWIYSSWKNWKDLTYDEVLDWNISDIEDYYSNYMEDIIYYLEELISDLNDAIQYKKIYQSYINNQLDIFSDWIKLRDEN